MHNLFGATGWGVLTDDGIDPALHMFLIIGLGEDRHWDNDLGGSPEGAVVYNSLQLVVVFLFLFFSYLSLVLPSVITQA